MDTECTEFAGSFTEIVGYGSSETTLCHSEQSEAISLPALMPEKEGMYENVCVHLIISPLRDHSNLHLVLPQHERR